MKCVNHSSQKIQGLHRLETGSPALLHGKLGSWKQTFLVSSSFSTQPLQVSLWQSCAKEDFENLLSLSLVLGNCTKRGSKTTFISHDEGLYLLCHSQLPSSIWRRQEVRLRPQLVQGAGKNPLAPNPVNPRLTGVT